MTTMAPAHFSQRSCSTTREPAKHTKHRPIQLNNVLTVQFATVTMKVIVITVLSEALTTAVTLLQLFHLKPFFTAE